MQDSTLFQRWETFNKGMDSESILRSFASHLEYSLSKDKFTATPHDLYLALALAARDRMVERWIHTQQTYYRKDVKRVYYLSAEYLIGRALVNSLINLGIYDETRTALKQVGLDLADLVEQEPDAGLGNGGLGRLAACFLDSMAALELPAYGYGIRYEFGIFEQVIRHNRQLERPELWLKAGNPWEVARPERAYVVHFYGQTRHLKLPDGQLRVEWVDTQRVIGMAYDYPIDGYGNESVNTLRLWAARASKEFDLDYFHHGNYLKAVEEKNLSENISKVLYPNDTFFEGQELRLKQQYFFVSCSIRDIVRRYLVSHSDFTAFPDKAAIQLNDTHPSLAIAELMRLLIDEHELQWEVAWDLTVRTFAYTNHTLLAEALERWPVSMLGNLLPRHLEIIYEINRRFLREVAVLHPGDDDRLRRVSLIEEQGDKHVRMAHLAIVGSHSVNGVSKLHTRLLMERELREFHELLPTRFNNKTNGVTQRRWLLAANPALAALISARIGTRWPLELDQLRQLEPLAEDPELQQAFATIKDQNKRALAELTRALTGLTIDPRSIFDVQVKRIHEYKRQLLNALHFIATWLRLKHDGPGDFHPRTVIIGGKAAPDYKTAKLIIRLICSAADRINNDATTSELLRVVFLPNYRVSLAERIIPAADLAEQISTAGFEASGTSNMKFMLNGALTIGTLDGANIEMLEEVGEDNIFIFGHTTEALTALRPHYQPRTHLEGQPWLREAIDMIRDGFFSPEERGLFEPLMRDLLDDDRFFVLADFAAYAEAQQRVTAAYANSAGWLRRAILNVARSGRFSSDRAIREYNRDIWHAEPISVTREAMVPRVRRGLRRSATGEFIPEK
ncbi:MAG: glycogen/starch/alpha-glucan phosphorylase [Proteobacteria bacterium]|nr:glycogen/starch/alpha-glucan phosphorylase [Pseudomonadota bacterium]